MIGVLGGSGVYELDGLEDVRWEKQASPFGEPSDELLHGSLAGVELVFLPRHGRGHRIPPSEVNYRANIDALKRAGVTDVVSVSARRNVERPIQEFARFVSDTIVHFLADQREDCLSPHTTEANGV